MFALCKTCRKALKSYIVDALFGGDSQQHWIHYLQPSRDERHPPMPLPGIRERTLLCSTCHSPQARDRHGWHCTNEHCPGSEE